MSIVGSPDNIPLRPIDPNAKTTKAPKKPLPINPVTTPTSGAENIASNAIQDVKSLRATPFTQVKRVPYISEEVLREKLRPGDIFLSYYPENSDLPAAGIRAGQILGKLVTPTSTDESHNFVHAGFYVGDGKVSEAVSDGIRINTLDSDRFKLKPGMTHGFLIVRPTNQAMAQEACKIAEELSAKTKNEPSSYKYSVGKALFSGFSGGSLDDKGIVRYLKGAAYAHNKIQPMSKSGIREFFCSYFVGWACQAGESKDVLTNVNTKLGDSDKIVFPDIKNLPPHIQSRLLSKWANEVAKKHDTLLKEHITLDFDPKLTSPQRLYGFFLEHPELFTQEMLIVSPQQEMEMKDIKK